ncbi:hypothetical protein HZS_7911, partial [Henneguya salminicola]
MKKIYFDLNLPDALNLIKLSWGAVSKKSVANCYALDTMNDDPEVNEHQHDVENLFDRLLLFVKVPEDVTYECFVEADQDLFKSRGVSEDEIFEMLKPSNKTEDNELDDQKLEMATQKSKEAMKALKTIPFFYKILKGWSSISSILS